MSAAESLDPNPRRLPRKDDKVVAAPNGPGCVSGVVVAYSSQRISIDTGSKTGRVHMEFSRFTWSTKRRAWVCWPKDVVSIVRKMDQDDERVFRASEFAALGAFILVDGRAGWITRHLGRPVAVAAGMSMNTMKGYAVCLLSGTVQLEVDDVYYDNVRRMWIGSRIEDA